jgi:hypothetical protein
MKQRLDDGLLIRWSAMVVSNSLVAAVVRYLVALAAGVAETRAPGCRGARHERIRPAAFWRRTIGLDGMEDRLAGDRR